tara:strand:- start:887 stop:1213 length:327 start_codon:yes stop_codon:yes gene_type:complete
MIPKPKDPNWVATFSLKRNADKAPGDSRPDMIAIDSDKVNPKTQKPYRKNFTIDNVWMEASGYLQEDKSLKITIKKMNQDFSSKGNVASSLPDGNVAPAVSLDDEIPF